MKKSLKLLLALFLLPCLLSCSNNDNNTQIKTTTQVNVTEEITEYVHQKDSYKVACVGDSLTAGHMWSHESYPVYLQEYLNTNYSDITYEVKNCGVNGTSITGYGGSWDDPAKRYIKQDIYKETVAFHPDVICLMLGTNDATNWNKAEENFVSYYNYLVENLQDAMDFEVDIIVMVPPNTLGSNTFNIPGDVIVNTVDPLIRDIASEKELPLLDVQEAFDNYEDGISKLIRNDNVHLSVEGAKYLASLVGESVYNLEN